MLVKKIVLNILYLKIFSKDLSFMLPIQNMQGAQMLTIAIEILLVFFEFEIFVHKCNIYSSTTHIQKQNPCTLDYCK